MCFPDFAIVFVVQKRVVRWSVVPSSNAVRFIALEPSVHDGSKTLVVIGNVRSSFSAGIFFFKQKVVKIFHEGLEQSVFRSVEARRMIDTHHALLGSDFLLYGETRLFRKPHHAFAVNFPNLLWTCNAMFAQIFFMQNANQVANGGRNKAYNMVHAVILPVVLQNT